MLRELPKPMVAVPAISLAQAQLVDRLLGEEYHVEATSVLMHGGRHLAHLARLQVLKGKAEGKAVVVLVGNMRKGGYALEAARRLHAWGASVRLVLGPPVEEFEGMIAPALERAQRQGLVIVEQPQQGGHLIIDGLMSLAETVEPSGRNAELIEWANRQLTPVISVEMPSGVDTATGNVHRVAIRASATLALGLPKTGLLVEKARAMVGEAFLGDLSVPPALYAAPGLELKVGAIFSESDIVRLR